MDTSSDPPEASEGEGRYEQHEARGHGQERQRQEERQRRRPDYGAAAKAGYQPPRERHRDERTSRHAEQRDAEEPLAQAQPLLHSRDAHSPAAKPEAVEEEDPEHS